MKRGNMPKEKIKLTEERISGLKEFIYDHHGCSFDGLMVVEIIEYHQTKLKIYEKGLRRLAKNPYLSPDANASYALGVLKDGENV